jgi:hypothetical protein
VTAGAVVEKVPPDQVRWAPPSFLSLFPFPILSLALRSVAPK